MSFPLNLPAKKPRIKVSRLSAILSRAGLGLIGSLWTPGLPAVFEQRGAFLRVQNRTDRVVRFAKPGLIGSEVWLDVKTYQPPSRDSTFVSQSALLRADEIPTYSFEKLEWSNQSRWPMITVPPDDSTDRTVDLQSAYPFHDGQEYEVTISTVLTVFVGEREDSGAGLFPLRMPVSATAHFVW